MSQEFFNGELMSFDADFPKRIAQARTTVGLTQAALASLAGVVQRQIAAYEGGEAKPRDKTLVRLASALGTSVEWLKTGKGEPPELDQYIPTLNLRQIPLITPEMIMPWIGAGKLKTHKLHPCKVEVSEKAFAIEIVGDSMAKSTSDGISFPAGSIVTFDPNEKVFNKDFVIALMENGMATFKQIFMDMVSISLAPIDIRYPMMSIPQDDVDSGKVTLIPAVYLEVPLYKMTAR